MSFIQWLSDKIGGGLVRMSPNVKDCGTPPKLFAIYHKKRKKK